ncbi:MAG TPA: class I SAM-dependent methyltransferase, partial [Blastocatellia bacterium]
MKPTAELKEMSALADPHKQRTREQWSADPCGAHAARGLEPYSREYFDAIEDYRYRVYAPWMREAIGFERFRGRKLLEVGCGTGTDLLQFARGGASVTGYDITERSIEIARRRFDLYGLKGDF